MNAVRTVELFRRVDAIEHAWCLRLNRGCSQPVVRDVFAAISKLGDGAFWYALIFLLPAVYGKGAVYPSVRMAVVGVIGLGLYKYLKSRLVRERPYPATSLRVRSSAPAWRCSVSCWCHSAAERAVSRDAAEQLRYIARPSLGTNDPHARQRD